MSGLRIGWALCGSFCTLTAVTAEMAKTVAAGHEVYPVFSAPMCTVDIIFSFVFQRDMISHFYRII